MLKFLIDFLNHIRGITKSKQINNDLLGYCLYFYNSFFYFWHKMGRWIFHANFITIMDATSTLLIVIARQLSKYIRNNVMTYNSSL